MKAQKENDFFLKGGAKTGIWISRTHEECRKDRNQKIKYF